MNLLNQARDRMKQKWYPDALSNDMYDARFVIRLPRGEKVAACLDGELKAKVLYLSCYLVGNVDQCRFCTRLPLPMTAWCAIFTFSLQCHGSSYLKKCLYVRLHHCQESSQWSMLKEILTIRILTQWYVLVLILVGTCTVWWETIGAF